MSSPVEQELDMSNAEATRAIGDSLNNHILEIFNYALYTMIFVATLRQIAARGEWPRQRQRLTVVICLIWLLATIHVGFDWNALYSVFVTHGQSRDSVLANAFGVGDENWSARRLAINIVGTTAMATNAMLAELTNIWRCWELYNHNWLLASILLAALISGLVSHALNMVVTYPSGSMSIGASISQVNWSIVYYSLTASINLLTTSLIVLRILAIAGMKSLRTYRGLIGILIESAFIYSAIAKYFYLLDQPCLVFTRLLPAGVELHLLVSCCLPQCCNCSCADHDHWESYVRRSASTTRGLVLPFRI
ncbi:hypothetical protein CPB85DRAFT_1304331 [Mucidula mucida]|nr:hypothetical protein CPB85DRAFT_1304331 [Mucidula mucida]